MKVFSTLAAVMLLIVLMGATIAGVAGLCIKGWDLYTNGYDVWAGAFAAGVIFVVVYSYGLIKDRLNKLMH